MLVFVAAERRELDGLLVHLNEVTAQTWGAATRAGTDSAGSA